MPRVVYIDAAGHETEVEAEAGASLMQTAVGNGIDGIVGECGGSLACATCHVVVEPDWLSKLPPVSDMENEMLDFAATERQPGSRLSCQIVASAELDGIRVTMPESQY